ncbi:hypothetical protein BJ138DRAFT_1102431 [Hygrophoropsis aurantiaca]|uniref:Uncharacterized protein n=1 Tax=Hygrophoropsis aurantiaca TaxID=72124 RepID=A0ACB8AAN2_9AGAM|nr:hypothetical protein BJ138DRAFT_1102431 [Hygrophoropsis aurantiaca]
MFAIQARPVPSWLVMRSARLFHSGTGDAMYSATFTYKLCDHRIIEDEVLQLKKQEGDLFQDTIARKCVLARNMKNSLTPVNRLPNEILLMCFGQAVQDWMDKNDGADERAVVVWAIYAWRVTEDDDFNLPCTPVFAISHVSHHWRQLAINTPSLWTNLIITPKFERHLDIFWDFLHRAKGMPIAANFRSFAFSAILPSSADVLLMEAIMPLIRVQQINALTFLSSVPILSFLCSQMIEQTTKSPTSPPSIAFSRLTSLSIFGLRNSGLRNSAGLTLNHLRCLLSTAPQLKTLELQHDQSLSAAERADETVITLPMLENLTIIDSNPFVCKVLDSLSAPNVRQLKLLIWDDWDPATINNTSCLFINNSNNSNSGSKLPRFPKVQNLTLSSTWDYAHLNTDLISAFPRITHLTLDSPSPFHQFKEPDSQAPPTFQCLQHITFDFAFKDADEIHLRQCFTWLPKLKDDDYRPLLISVFDRSTKSEQEVGDNHLFRYYEELQQYGTLDRSSSRLDEFMRWHARGGGEPEPAMQVATLGSELVY